MTRARSAALACLLSLAPASVGVAGALAPVGGAPLAALSGIRALGLGGTYAALSDDADGVSWNPAGIPLAALPAISLSHAARAGGISSDAVSAAFPAFGGAAAVSAATTWVAGVPRRDDAGAASGSSFGASERVARAAYGRALSDTIGVGFSGGALAGLFPGGRTSAVSGGAGVLWIARPNVRIGLFVANAGPASDGLELPLSVSAGTAWSVPGRPLLIALDVRWMAATGISSSVGAEATIRPWLVARAGYRIGPPSSALGEAAGVRAGLSLRRTLGVAALSLDYTLVPMGPLGLTHRAGLGISRAAAARASFGVLRAPEGLEIRPDGDRLLVGWSPVQGATGYNLYGGGAVESLRRLTSKPSAGTSVRLKAPLDRQLVVAVAGVRADGIEGPRSPAFIYRPTGATGVSNGGLEFDISALGFGEPPPTPTSQAPTPTPAPVRRRATAVATSAPAFPAPEGLRIGDFRGSPHIKWKAVDGAVGYYVHARVEGSKKASRVTPSPLAATELVFEMPPGSMIHFSVSAVDASGRESPHSREVPASR